MSCFLLDAEECQAKIVNLFKSAEQSVYYSAFLCDFDMILNNEVSMTTLITDAANRGISVNLLLNPWTEYGNLLPGSIIRKLPLDVNIRFVDGDFKPSWFASWFTNNCRYSYHHQKYLCIDEKVVMITGTDVNKERSGWLKKNCLDYYWHELGVVIPCNKAISDWVKNNHKKINPMPPLPLTCGWHEHCTMIELINTAKRNIHLECQTLITGNSSDLERKSDCRTHVNKIAKAIVQRIASAIADKDENFRVFILTNMVQQDEPSLVTRVFCKSSVLWSIWWMYHMAEQEGITSEEFEKYIVFGNMHLNGVQIKVHSNILIRDGDVAIRSSSNLSDRSLSWYPTDTELGVIIEGPEVQHLQTTLFQKYLGLNHITEMIGFLNMIKSGVGLVREFKWNPTIKNKLTASILPLLCLFSEGSHGGKRLVNWKIY
jgi:phosphatidylserine/phosphatidylglycerophosphate/cardiolipin synthase-like enzyme